MDSTTAELLKQVASKLDIPVETLWRGMVEYAPFVFYQWGTGVTIMLITLVIALIAVYRLRHESDSNAFFAASVLAAVSALCTLLSVGTLADSLAAKNAPQAWAAKYIINRLR